MDDGFPSDSGFDAFMALFVIVFIAAVLWSIFVAVRNYQAARKGGLDPFAVETDLAAKLANSQLLAQQQAAAAAAPATSLEDKLAELASARKKALEG